MGLSARSVVKNLKIFETSGRRANKQKKISRFHWKSQKFLVFLFGKRVQIFLSSEILKSRILDSNLNQGTGYWILILDLGIWIGNLDFRYWILVLDRDLEFWILDFNIGF